MLVDWLKDGYQNLVFAGVSGAARELDVNLLCLAGGVLGSDLRFGTTRNFIYDYAGPHVVDGLLLLAGTLGNHHGAGELAAHCRRYHPLPMTSVAVPLPDIPTVVVDDAEGTREAVRHLIDRHGYRRIGFIRGPVVNEEAERRFAAYRDVLAEKGIAFDTALVATGDFQPEAGAEAVRVFLDERKVSFQALVAANDHMVLGAMAALQRRGYQVPADVALIGFDDVDEARFAAPPLTTVRQPLYQQGERALQLLVARLRAAPMVPARLKMKTDLVVRESCGCSSGRVELTRRDASMVVGKTLESYLRAQQDEVAEALRFAVRSAAGCTEPGWENQLILAFSAEMSGAPRGEVATALERILRPVIAAGGDVSAWHSVITTLRRLVIPTLLHEPDRWLFAEDLCQAARIQIADFAERAQARQKLHVDRWARTLSETSEALLATVNVPALLRAVADQMPRFGIQTCFVSLFPDSVSQGEPRASAEARLVLAYGGGAAAGEGELFAARDILPARAWPRDRRWTFIVEPLAFERKQFGMLLMELSPREGIIYESLREQISSALNSANLVQQVVQEVTQRQIAESDRRKSVQDLFDNMKQAIFTVGPDGRIGQEVSAYAKSVFGDVPITGARVVDLLQLDAITDSEAVGRMRLWIECIFGSDDFQWSISSDDPIRALTYRRPAADGAADELRALEIDYAPIYDGALIAKVMFLIKDVTEVQRLEAEIARRDEQNRENLARVRQIVAMEPDLFTTFVRESEQVLVQCEVAARDLGDPALQRGAIHRLFRAMHTLKGNARIFKMTALQSIAHTAEDHFQKVRDGEVALTAESVRQLATRIGEVRLLLGELDRLGRQVFGFDERGAASGHSTVRIPEARLATLRRVMDQVRETSGTDGGAGRTERLAALERAIARLTTPSLADVLAPATQMAVDLARERGKRLDGVALEGMDLFLGAETMRKLRDLVVHAVRNAVDHGLEAPAERAAAGKPAAAAITISAREEAGFTVLQIADDGRGIDPRRVASRVVERGLIPPADGDTLTEDEACELLFHPGLSTAEATTDVSGRGVGMDVIRAIARELGGEARLTSIRGVGARLSVRIPIVEAPRIRPAAPAALDVPLPASSGTSERRYT